MRSALPSMADSNQAWTATQAIAYPGPRPRPRPVPSVSVLPNIENTAVWRGFTEPPVVIGR